jgi:hypothetical protein
MHRFNPDEDFNANAYVDSRLAKILKGGSLTTAGQNVLRRAAKKIYNIPNLRMLVDGEGPHWLTSNYVGPGTNLEEADKYGPTDAADAIARDHDIAYDKAGKLLMGKKISKEEALHMIHEADEVMIAAIKALPESERGIGTRLASRILQSKKWFEKKTGIIVHGGSMEDMEVEKLYTGQKVSKEEAKRLILKAEEAVSTLINTLPEPARSMAAQTTELYLKSNNWLDKKAKIIHGGAMLEEEDVDEVIKPLRHIARTPERQGLYTVQGGARLAVPASSVHSSDFGTYWQLIDYIRSQFPERVGTDAFIELRNKIMNNVDNTGARMLQMNKGEVKAYAAQLINEHADAAIEELRAVRDALEELGKQFREKAYKKSGSNYSRLSEEKRRRVREAFNNRVRIVNERLEKAGNLKLPVGTIVRPWDDDEEDEEREGDVVDDLKYLFDDFIPGGGKKPKKPAEAPAAVPSTPAETPVTPTEEAPTTPTEAPTTPKTPSTPTEVPAPPKTPTTSEKMKGNTALVFEGVEVPITAQLKGETIGVYTTRLAKDLPASDRARVVENIKKHFLKPGTSFKFNHGFNSFKETVKELEK